MATRERQQPKTWSLLGDVRRKPTPYEVVTSKFHYHFRRDPQPFEHPNMPLNQWYLDYREGSPFQVDDWEGFRDPYKLTYKDYVALQRDQEVFVDKLIDQHEAANSVGGLSPEWVSTLRELYVPLRFPLHILQITALYVGQMAPSSFVTNCAYFQASDELRRIQRIAYWTKVVANEHGDDIAATATARTAWEAGESWQPLRKVLEELLVAHDWGEAFVALNLLIKPALDCLVNEQFAELANQNSDEFLSTLFTHLALDSKRSEDWTTALVKYALVQRPELHEVVKGWVAAWEPRVDEAVAGLTQLFEGAANGIPAQQLTEAVAARRQALLAACDL